MASKQLSTDEVVELILDNDFDFSEGDSSDEEGGGLYAYTGQQHFDSAEVAAFSRGITAAPMPESSVGFLPNQEDDSATSDKSVVSSKDTGKHTI